MAYNDLDIAFRKIDELNKKLEIYYTNLFVENELSFIMNGQYFLEDELADILAGTYSV